jgi:hypothetical protein
MQGVTSSSERGEPVITRKKFRQLAARIVETQEDWSRHATVGARRTSGSSSAKHQGRRARQAEKERQLRAEYAELDAHYNA